MGTQKNYYVLYNVGKARYVLNHHDGSKTHADGSRFYDIAIFGNKQELSRGIRALEADGYAKQ